MPGHGQAAVRLLQLLPQKLRHLSVHLRAVAPNGARAHTAAVIVDEPPWMVPANPLRSNAEQDRMAAHLLLRTEWQYSSFVALV